MSYPVVAVDGGTIRGIDNAGVVSFLGVPYGASTAGENRFQRPQPVAPWTGVRDALTFGPSAPQVDTRSHSTGSAPRLLTLLYPRTGSPAEGGPISEDCLRVNVWSPSNAEGLPVLVWLHGGGFTHGSGNEMAFNGDTLAAAANIVVVTVTHRLGILGFLDLREEGAPESANAGMLDLVAALEWVQRNIAALGGDPNRVTIAGQSGGSAKVAALTAIPAAHGLFSRGIMMSGPFTHMTTPDEAATLRRTVADIAGITSLQRWRSEPLEALLAAQAEQLRRAPLAPSSEGPPSLAAIPGFAPSLDPGHLPHDPFQSSGPAELMIGWTTHEAAMFLAEDPAFTTDLTAEEAATRVDPMSAIDGVTYADLAQRFPAEPPHLLLARRMSELMFAGPSRELAAQAHDAGSQVWTYEFAQPTEVLGGLLGACHSLDLAYAFGTVDRVPLTGRSLDRLAISREMMRAFAAFARMGNPGWDAWTPTTPSTHTFGVANRSGRDPVDDIDLTAPLAPLDQSLSDSAVLAETRKRE